MAFRTSITVFVSFAVNSTVVLIAAKAASFFARNPAWAKNQKWFMSGILVALALKMALTKDK